MAGENVVLVVDEDRDQKSKLIYGADELVDLCFRVEARVIVVRPQIFDWEMLNRQRARDRRARAFGRGRHPPEGAAGAVSHHPARVQDWEVAPH